MEKVKFENLSKPLKIVIVWGLVNLSWFVLLLLIIISGSIFYAIQ